MTEAICATCCDTFNPHGGPEPEGDHVGTTLDGLGIFRHWARTNDGPEQGEACGGLGIETPRSAMWRLAPSADPRPTRPAVFTIPGTFYATVQAPETAEGLAVTRLAFVPAASDAGYPGPAAVVEDQDYGTADAADAYYGPDDVDGRFWSAMRAALAPVTWWQVNDDDNEHTADGPAVPIEWTE